MGEGGDWAEATCAGTDGATFAAGWSIERSMERCVDALLGDSTTLSHALAIITLATRMRHAQGGAPAAAVLAARALPLLLRRSGAVPVKGRLTWQDIVMDQDAHRVTRCGRALHLGPTEYRLLEFFLQHPGRVFSREQLLDAVWGRDIHVEPRTVDVHIRRLRKAVNGDGEIDVIRTVRSAGYALDVE
jgi:hypothetical protein